ncbi:hypothetical protein [Suttonella indologenes]|uniref:Uncharacterized protein n=1 Tax=Suttonella indologenes TaxID=13276 RepID=A0A380MUJ6_9GAMM|nr:hypothetical protein [Suttonella indologenes]SUO95932.1 Uncharacterised protein [Suttonella indologenes]
MKKWLCLFILSPLAYAHSPQLSCKIEAENVLCTGGFSDGSSAFGVEVKVLDYGDKVLHEGRFDKDSRFSFAKPEGEYYVRFDGGSGHQLELDYQDIEE